MASKLVKSSAKIDYIDYFAEMRIVDETTSSCIEGTRILAMQVYSYVGSKKKYVVNYDRGWRTNFHSKNLKVFRVFASNYILPKKVDSETELS